MPDDEATSVPGRHDVTGDRVSVLVATLTRPPSLLRLMAALAAGAERPDEVVLVDQSGRLLGEQEHELLACGLTLRHVPMAGRGLSRAQNLAAARASGDVLMVTDDDCVPDEHWVAIARHELTGPDHVDLLTGRVLPLPPEGDRTIELSSRTYPERRVLGRDVLPWDMGTGGNFAVRREWWRKVRGNDERLGSGTRNRAGNDLDLFWRLVSAGARGVYEPSFLVLHERATAQEREDRVDGYGRGIGAAVVSWSRLHDRRAPWIAAHWLRLRGRLAAGHVYHRRWAEVGREAAVMRGTLWGLAAAPASWRDADTAALPMPDSALPMPDSARFARHAAAAPVPLGRRVVVISPHCDDGVLSLGATMASVSRRGGDVVLVTVMSGETRDLPAGRWDLDSGFATPAQATAARHAEDERAAAAVGARLVLLGETDAQYPATCDDGELYARMLAAAAGADDVLVPGFPLDNVDHARVHDLLRTRGVAGARLRLYLEQPYAMWRRYVPLSDAVALADRPLEGSVWRRVGDVSAVDRRAKTQGVAAYRSQLALLASPTRWPLLGRRPRLLLAQLARETRRRGEWLSDPLPTPASGHDDG